VADAADLRQTRRETGDAEVLKVGEIYGFDSLTRTIGCEMLLTRIAVNLLRSFL
jgi:hypothetical protein